MAPVCWVMTSGEAGTVSQALGLAEALGFAEPVVKTVGLRLPWRWLPNWPFLASLSAADPARDPLQPPWPDLLISSGRKAALLSIAIRKASNGATQTVHVQDPKGAAAHFDLLVVPEHDRVRGPNVLVTGGAPHRVTRARLAAGAAEFAHLAQNLPRPLVAVLVGGSSRSYRLDADWVRALCAQLEAMCRESGCGLLVTPSRRTGGEPVAALRAGLAGLPAMLWDGAGANPYFGFLALADAILISSDSVSMISEACSTGKPVMLARVPGRSARFEQFYAKLERQGLIRWFDGRLQLWQNGRLDDMDRLAAEVAARLPRLDISHNINYPIYPKAGETAEAPVG